MENERKTRKTGRKSGLNDHERYALWAYLGAQDREYLATAELDEIVAAANVAMAPILSEQAAKRRNRDEPVVLTIHNIEGALEVLKIAREKPKKEALPDADRIIADMAALREVNAQLHTMTEGLAHHLTKLSDELGVPMPAMLRRPEAAGLFD